MTMGVALAIPMLAASGQASAAPMELDSSVTVVADQATMVALAGEPATVVIGNALYADISLEKGMVFIHGRQFGTTNVIVLDKDNKELANFELHVVRGGSNNLTIYKAGSAFPTCARRFARVRSRSATMPSTSAPSTRQSRPSSGCRPGPASSPALQRRPRGPSSDSCGGASPAFVYQCTGFGRFA
jgi:hypothetical protein